VDYVLVQDLYFFENEPQPRGNNHPALRVWLKWRHRRQAWWLFDSSATSRSKASAAGLPKPCGARAPVAVTGETGLKVRCVCRWPWLKVEA
jgi:hypothetical protein